MANGGVIENGVKLVGEVILPGASLLLDGNIKAGAGHAVVGIATAAFLGTVRLLVSANSFSKSVTDQHLHTHLLEMFNMTKDKVSEGISDLQKVRENVTRTTDTATDASSEASTAPA